MFSFITFFDPLSKASPATVSRCGMIYMEPVSIGWRAMFTSWLDDQPELIKKESELVSNLFEWMIDPTLLFLQKNCKEVLSTPDMAMVRSMMYMFEMHLDAEKCAEDNAPKVIKSWIQGVFMFSMVWSIGATVDIDGREKFSDLLHEIQTGNSEDYPPPAGLKKIDTPLPDYAYDFYFKLRLPIFDSVY